MCNVEDTLLLCTSRLKSALHPNKYMQTCSSDDSSNTLSYQDLCCFEQEMLCTCERKG